MSNLKPVKKQEMSFFKWENNAFLAVVIGVLSFAVYVNTIPNLLNVDDELIYNNHILNKSGTAALQDIFTQPYYADAVGNKYEYRPVVLLSYFAEFSLFGRNPHVSHSVNVLIFSATCVLIYYLLLSLFRQHDSRGIIAFMTALLFAVHTVHTEAVASIKNRDELLSLLFAVTAWFFALRFADSKSPITIILFLLFFLTGLFAKQTSIAFAVLIPVSIIMFRKITLRQLMAVVLPAVLLATFFSPVYLLFKKVMLFAGQIIFIIIFYYFVSERSKLVGFVNRITTGLINFLKSIPSVIKKFVFKSIGINGSGGFAGIRFNSKLLKATVIMILLITASAVLLSRKNMNLKETVKDVQWNLKDRIHDFNELQVTPALQTPAPAVVPIAGRKLNFVEVPLLYVSDKEVKVATSIVVLGKYLRLMLIPYHLGFYYGFGQVPIRGFNYFDAFVYPIVFLLIITLLIYLLVSRRHPIAAFGILFFLVSIFPLSNLLTPIAGIMAERLAYAASLGYCIAFSSFFAYPLMVTNDKIFGVSRTTASKISAAIFTFFIVVYSGATIARNFQWKDRLTLMRSDIGFLKDSARANHLLATHLAHMATVNRQQNKPENVKMLNEAVYHFKQALEIYPEFPYAWYDLAKAYLFLGENQNAINAYVKSTQIDSSFAPSWFELGVVHSQLGRTQDAENAYHQAIRRDSTMIEAYINLSYSYYQQGIYNESLEVCFTALKHNPNQYNVLVNIGRIYLRLNDTDKALVYMEKAAAINKSDKAMMQTMADLYQSLGNLEKASYYRGLQ